MFLVENGASTCLSANYPQKLGKVVRKSLSEMNIL